MKIRDGFVSNSSSSSFIIRLEHLTAEQLNKILNINDPKFDSDPWSITLEEGKIEGFTWMDNFSMSDYFEKIGIADEHIEWGD